MSLCSHRVLFAVTCLGLAAWFPSAHADDPKKPKLEFRRAETKPADGLTEATVPGQKDKIYLHKEFELTEADVAEASVGVDTKFNPCIDIVFTKAGAEKMAKCPRRRSINHSPSSWRERSSAHRP
jgi:hypothetical protein